MLLFNLFLFNMFIIYILISNLPTNVLYLAHQSKPLLPPLYCLGMLLSSVSSVSVLFVFLFFFTLILFISIVYQLEEKTLKFFLW